MRIIILFSIFATGHLMTGGLEGGRVRMRLLLSALSELIVSLLGRELQENLVRSHSAGGASFLFPRHFEVTFCVQVCVGV